MENHIIDLSYVQEKIEMAKRKELLEKHPYKISQGKDGKWRTYLPDQKNGRKLVKRSSLKGVEDVVNKFYQLKKEQVGRQLFCLTGLFETESLTDLKPNKFPRLASQKVTWILAHEQCFPF